MSRAGGGVRRPRRVLLMAHTLLSMRYVAAVAELLAGDGRVQMAWTQAPDRYGTGVTWALLAGGAVGGRRVPVLRLEVASRQPWDLVVFGTHGSNNRVRAPQVLVAHGLGGGKVVAAPEIGITTPQEYTYGPDWSLVDGRPKYRLMLEASHEVRGRAVGRCRPLAPVIRVVGSLEADRLLASRPLRGDYRAALGLRSGQIAVVLISTFGPDSLLARHGRGLLEVTARLPASEMAVLVSCHPHVWAGRADGRADATSGGTDGGWPPRLARLAQHGRGIVCPPGVDWVPYLVAADVAVIDHGSLGLYWSLLARPTIAVPVPAGSVDPGSPIAALHATAPRLTDPAGLGPAVQAARRSFDPGAFAAWRKQVAAYPGQAARRTREALYGLLGLAVPAGPPPAPQPVSVQAQGWQDALLPTPAPTPTAVEIS